MQKLALTGQCCSDAAGSIFPKDENDRNVWADGVRRMTTRQRPSRQSYQPRDFVVPQLKPIYEVASGF